MDFAQDIQSADNTTIVDVTRNWIDIDDIMAHMVVNRVLWHMDSPWQAYETNYYWYEDPIRGKFTLVPWDLDLILPEYVDNFSDNPTPRAGDMDLLLEKCNDGSSGEYYGSTNCSRLFIGFTIFEDEYTNAVQKFKDEVYPKVQEKYQYWMDQIRPATIQMNQIHGDPVDWEPGIGVRGAITEQTWREHTDLGFTTFQLSAEEMIGFLQSTK